MSKPTGGPAFPVSTAAEEGHQDGPITWQFPGMMLRDYFAAKAMQGALAYPKTSLKSDMVSRYAEYAYAIADAMLAERNKGE